MSDQCEPQFQLSDLRKQLGLSQVEVARRMGVNRQRVCQIEQDFPRLKFPVVLNYVKAIGGNVTFGGGSFSVTADTIHPDPRGPRDHGYRKRSEPVVDMGD